MSEHLSAEERRLRAKIAAHAAHAKHGSAKLLEAANAKNKAKYDDQVDPDRLLDPAERAKRAAAARSADMTRLSFLAAKARKATAAAEAADRRAQTQKAFVDNINEFLNEGGDQ